MTDYWKSNAKKFCQICKTWYADNKISIENHERGLKHKAMIQQRLRESAQKSQRKEREQADLQRTLREMERAALASMSPAYKSSAHAHGPQLPPPAPSRAEAPQRPIYPSEAAAAFAVNERKRRFEIRQQQPQYHQYSDIPIPPACKKTVSDFAGECTSQSTSPSTSSATNLTPVEIRQKTEPNNAGDFAIPIKLEDFEKNNHKKAVQPVVSGLGPWIPIVKEEKEVHQVKDLPDQLHKKNASQIVEEMEMDPSELTFQEKVLPSSSKKTSKSLQFKKRSFANKGNLRTRAE